MDRDEFFFFCQRRPTLEEGLARSIHSVESLAKRFGSVPSSGMERDEFFFFCQRRPTLEEAVERFGERVYEAELEGRILIEDGRVAVL
jgi:DNA processing protein